MRLFLFAALQSILALLFRVSGSSSSWQESIRWWPVTVFAANLITLGVLITVFRAEGARYRDLWKIDRARLGGDLLLLLGIFVFIGPVAYLPNVWLANLLLGGPEQSMRLFIQPLPAWAVYGQLVLFPVTQGLVELATYFGYVMPRLEALTHKPWLSVGLASLFLGLQHVAVPLIPTNPNFMLWRALMFIPFALSMGILLHWRPRLLPYCMVIHALTDVSVSIMFLMV
jgi:hypothetical protein